MTRRLLILALATVTLASPALAMELAPATEIIPFLLLGFVVGLAHAIEADHVAAVAAMVGQGGSRRGVVARGAAWGMGHTLALFIICSTVLFMGLTISDSLGAALELVVGVMIMGLGGRVFWRMWRARIHIHVHEHDGTRHIHAHSHANDRSEHHASAHDHTHGARALLPTLGVGLVHGAAGSAGLLVLTMASAPSTFQAIAAFAVFGIGSIIGMTLLTAAASFPLAYIHRGANWMRVSLACAIGTLALVVGGSLALESLSGLAGSRI